MFGHSDVSKVNVNAQTEFGFELRTTRVRIGFGGMAFSFHLDCIFSNEDFKSLITALVSVFVVDVGSW